MGDVPHDGHQDLSPAARAAEPTSLINEQSVSAVYGKKDQVLRKGAASAFHLSDIVAAVETPQLGSDDLFTPFHDHAS